MDNKSKRDTQIHTLDDRTKTTLLQQLIPNLEDRQSTLIIYNTVSRLLSGDLQHTVTVNDIWKDLFLFPTSWIVVGIGTTNWIHRNGEMMPDGTTHHLHFWWADPNTSPQSHVIDLAESTEEFVDESMDTKATLLMKTSAEFPFLALAVCNPEKVFTYTIAEVSNLHEWLEQILKDEGIRVAGIQVQARCKHVKSTDAHYIPDDGLDLSKGYVGDEYFYTFEHDMEKWVMNGVYSSDETILPFISVPSAPVHLHGYQADHRVGGHIVHAEILSATVSIYPLDDVLLKIHNV